MKPSFSLADFSANVVDALRALEGGRVALAMGHLRKITDDLEAGLAGLRALLEAQERERSLLGLFVKQQAEVQAITAGAVEQAELRIAAAKQAEAEAHQLQDAAVAAKDRVLFEIREIERRANAMTAGLARASVEPTGPQ